VMSLSLGQRQQEQHRTQQIRQQALIQSNQKIRHQLEQHVVERTQRLQQMNEKLSLLSTTDALTGIPNRRYLDSYLKTEVARAAADARPISIAMVDIDCFKQFNDAYGHVAGDKCLRATAQELRRQLPRASDLVARFGGEEFFIVMPQTSADGAMIVCERLRRGMLSLRIDVGGSLVGVTVSIGLFSTVPHDASDVASLVETVDRALYRAKLSGRNQVMPVSGPPQDASAKHQLH